MFRTHSATGISNREERLALRCVGSVTFSGLPYAQRGADVNWALFTVHRSYIEESREGTPRVARPSTRSPSVQRVEETTLTSSARCFRASTSAARS